MTGPAPSQRIASQARIVPAFGQRQSIWRWSQDRRCFVSVQCVANRIAALDREPEAADVEAAMCFTHRMWRCYRINGYITEEMLDELG